MIKELTNGVEAIGRHKLRGFGAAKVRLANTTRLIYIGHVESEKFFSYLGREKEVIQQ